MENQIKIFNYSEKEIRTIIKDGDPWWVLKDVCGVLGVGNSRDAAARLDEDEKADVDLIDTSSNGTQQSRKFTIINESGLYSVILLSRKPEAKTFKRWITHEVLPAIRKHGGYLTPQKTEELIANPDLIIELATTLKKEREAKKQLAAENQSLVVETETQKQLIGELKPKADYVDYILSGTGAVAITQIAADYSISAKKLNKILEKEGVQRNVAGQWILYSEYMGKGYTKSETFTFNHKDGTPDAKMTTKWTQKGRLLINEILNRLEIYANMDVVGKALDSAI